MEDLEKRLIVGITGNKGDECIKKIEEVGERRINCVALFLQYLPLKERKDVYRKLEKSKIKEIPLVHIRDDMEKEELGFLFQKYGSKYFTIHENHFDVIYKWKGWEKSLFLEMSTDNQVAENVKVEKIGGFCVDLAHYQKQKDRNTIDYKYVYERREKKELFKCNHLGGYSPKEMEDLHYVKSKNDFCYLKELPSFVFGEIVAIEINNTIKEQVEFKKNIIDILKNK